MPTYGSASIFDQKTLPTYLCIINASWVDANSGSKTGVFAVHVRAESLDPIEVIAKATVDIMRSSGLPISPSHVTVVREDKVVSSWLAGRDFLNEDLYDRVEILVEGVNPKSKRSLMV